MSYKKYSSKTVVYGSRKYLNKKKYNLLNIFVLILFLPLTLYLFNRQTGIFSRAYLDLTGRKANLIIDLIGSNNAELIRPNLAQGGEEKGGMLKSVITQVNNIKPGYIRIDHIYDFYNVVDQDVEGNLVYKWEKLDEEIGDILAVGAKPFLSLSYMPGAISTGSEVEIPKNWEDWQEVVKNTVEHVSGIDNLGISDVYYEVWNEPDLFGDYKVGTGKDYRQLYKYAALGASAAKKTYPFKFGGPATTGLYKNWFDGLLIYTKENNFRIDFYSWHRYSKHLKDFENDFKAASVWLEDYPEYSDLEFVISESGFNSENDSGYDNEYSAIHTLGLYTLVSILNIKQDVKIFTFEIKDGPGDTQYWGRWGLLTHENFGQPVTKPRYKAIEYLNSMQGISTPVYGQGSWVSAFSVKNTNGYKLLVINYDSYGKHYENVPIQFVGLPSRKFIFRRVNFLGDTIEFPVETPSDNWKTEILMKPNSAMIIEIVPIGQFD
ncbi:hypothetical protein A2Z67_06575 [Candidatus Woesebacteria bacterium RBG_13_36_22]|uniref:Glycosyl hydrolases family 39 N-terminal catalytic domain-containing protein n=1 Tax=Candidatus Woesebacteria bacterium RBG_13_36_22 TaxID=1802478 RepID=A0A1F7X1L2_9BACT|nr:MAG: hypothetical protein A2Z67_06575 [Candidatus Woesebacteria bacterium RBG_13_36_22]